MEAFLDELIEHWVPAPARAPEPAPRWECFLDDAETGSAVWVCDAFLPPAEQAALYAHCAALPGWEFDKPLGSRPCARQRRGVCMQAAPGIEGYRYSRQLVRAAPLDGVLGPLLARANAARGTDFNSWLLNWYRPRAANPAGDYLSPHADDETTLAAARDGRSVVFGLTLTDDPRCERVLRFRPNRGGAARDLVTRGGQAYAMEGALQKHWTHEVPRALRAPGGRISLTARKFRAGA